MSRILLFAAYIRRRYASQKYRVLNTFLWRFSPPHEKWMRAAEKNVVTKPEHGTRGKLESKLHHWTLHPLSSRNVFFPRDIEWIMYGYLSASGGRNSIRSTHTGRIIAAQVNHYHLVRFTSRTLQWSAIKILRQWNKNQPAHSTKLHPNKNEGNEWNSCWKLV